MPPSRPDPMRDAREWEAEMARFRERNRAHRLSLAPHEEGSDAWIDKI